MSRQPLVWVGTILVVAPAAGVARTPRPDYVAKWRVLHKAKRYPEAIRLLSQAVRDYPDDGWLHIYLAHAHRRSGATATALPFYQRALSLLPNSDGIRRNVYWGYVGYAGYLGFKHKRWARAVAWYDRAIKLVPNKYEAWNLLANAQRNRGRIDLALAPLKRAFALDPAHPRAKRGLAGNFRATVRAGMRQKDSARAAAWADLARRAYPKDADVRRRALVAYFRAKDRARLRAAAAGSTDAASRALVAGLEALLAAGTTKARHCFERASRLRPKDHRLDEVIGDLYRSRVSHLGYRQQMAHPEHLSAVAFYQRAVKKYFRARPYRQRITMTSPLRGRFCVTQGAGGKSYHYGLTGHYAYDISLCGKNAMGTPVYAVAAGVVTWVRANEPDHPIGSPVNLAARANIVRIRHQGKIRSSYVHLQRGSARVRVGDRVRQGQQIGLIGNSGRSGGPHLHFVVSRVADRISVPAYFTGLRGRPRRRSGPIKALRMLRAGHEFHAR